MVSHPKHLTLPLRSLCDRLVEADDLDQLDASTSPMSLADACLQWWRTVTFTARNLAWATPLVIAAVALASMVIDPRIFWSSLTMLLTLLWLPTLVVPGAQRTRQQVALDDAVEGRIDALLQLIARLAPLSTQGAHATLTWTPRLADWTLQVSLRDGISLRMAVRDLDSALAVDHLILRAPRPVDAWQVAKREQHDPWLTQATITGGGGASELTLEAVQRTVTRNHPPTSPDDAVCQWADTITHWIILATAPPQTDRAVASCLTLTPLQRDTGTPQPDYGIVPEHFRVPLQAPIRQTPETPSPYQPGPQDPARVQAYVRDHGRVALALTLGTLLLFGVGAAWAGDWLNSPLWLPMALVIPTIRWAHLRRQVIAARVRRGRRVRWRSPDQADPKPAAEEQWLSLSRHVLSRTGHDAEVDLNKSFALNFTQPPHSSGDHHRVGVEVRQGRAKLQWCVVMRVDSQASLPVFRMHARDLDPQVFFDTVWPVLACYADAMGEALAWQVLEG